MEKCKEGYSLQHVRSQGDVFQGSFAMGLFLSSQCFDNLIPALSFMTPPSFPRKYIPSYTLLPSIYVELLEQRVPLL